MKERVTRILRYIGAALILGMLLFASLGIGARLESQQQIATQAPLTRPHCSPTWNASGNSPPLESTSPTS